MSGQSVDAASAAGGEGGGVAHGEALTAFVSALMGADQPALDAARSSLSEAIGPQGVVDAAGVAAHFQMMVRIADGTGTPLDANLEVLSRDLRAEMKVGDFASADNTPPPGPLQRLAGRIANPLAGAVFRMISRKTPPSD